MVSMSFQKTHNLSPEQGLSTSAWTSAQQAANHGTLSEEFFQTTGHRNARHHGIHFQHQPYKL